MQRDALIAVAAGLLSALFFLSSRWSLFGALVLEFFSPLSLIAAGLALGLAATGIAAAAAGLAVALVSDLPRLAIFAAADAVPALVIVRFALLNRPGPGGAMEWYPPGFVLTWIALLAAGMLVAAAMIAGFGPDGLQARVSGHLQPLHDLLSQSRTRGAEAERLFEALAFFAPGLIATGWILKLVINGGLAQKFVTRRGLNRRPSPQFRNLALPPWYAGVTVAGTAVALLGSGWLGFVGANIALILWAPYFLLGLAVLHTVSNGWPGRTMALVAAYVILVLFGWPAVVLAAVGFLEQWLGLRDRFGGPGRGNERKE